MQHPRSTGSRPLRKGAQRAGGLAQSLLHARHCGQRGSIDGIFKWQQQVENYKYEIKPEQAKWKSIKSRRENVCNIQQKKCTSLVDACNKMQKLKARIENKVEKSHKRSGGKWRKKRFESSARHKFK